MTWAEVDREVNRTARALRAVGVREKDVVALLMDNRPEFLLAQMALSRLGAIGALLNTSITGAPLAHQMNVAGTSRVLVGAEHVEKFDAVLGDLEAIDKEHVWVQRDPDGGSASTASAGPHGDFDALVGEQPATPFEGPTPSADDVSCYIYTSGTTGLPKAAVIPNRRLMSAGFMVGRGIFALRAGEVVYTTTPLYHGSGQYGGWSAALASGACLALRRRFSASAFWDDVRAFDAKAFYYVGELCRYLVNQPPHSDDRDHPLRVACGVGLRPEVWGPFQSRFAIPKIVEMYGATEGAAAVLNLAGRSGMVGRKTRGIELVTADPETGEFKRGVDGYCTRVSGGETGLMLIRIASGSPFDGYVDSEATKKKIQTDVFRRGDRFFNTGDLLTLHEGGWLSFADRVGDTYRWKGENVSTHEVAEVLNGAPGVLESNVYGVEVPGTDGRAGMASLNCSSAFSVEAFQAHVLEHLPNYQRPYFLRLQTGMRITVTFKHQKVDYRREGFDPSKVKDPLLFLEGDRYVPLDPPVFEAIREGRVTLR